MLPTLARAVDIGSVGTTLEAFNKLLGTITVITFTAALAVFFWGLAKYMWSAGSEEAKAQGRRVMVGGVIALFVMSSVWGIITFFAKDLGLEDIKTIKTPLIGR